MIAPIPLLSRLTDTLNARLPKSLPPFTLPPLVGQVLARLPVRPPTVALVSALNLGLDRLVPRETFAPLAGKSFAISVLDAGLTLRFAYDGQRFSALGSDAAVDSTISASTRDFIALLTREEDPDTLFFSRRLRMEGDTELGLLVKNTLDGIDFSAFHPSRLIGRFGLQSSGSVSA